MQHNRKARGRSRGKRSARSFRRSGRVVLALALEFLKLVLVIGGLIALGLLFHSGGDRLYARLFFACVGLFVAVYVTSSIYRGRIICPLCLGTVLKTQRCRKHRNARRALFLTHKATVFFDILTRLGFTCMYCGTRFRLRR